MLNVPNCATYTNKLCSACVVAYTLKDGNCLSCDTGYTKTSAGKCICDEQNGYRVSDLNTSLCAVIVVNCKNYTDDKCTKCNLAYLLSAGQCSGCDVNYRISNLSDSTCVASLPNCNQYTSDTVCLTCDPSYRVSQVDPSQCLPSVPNCKNYTDDKCT